MRNNRAPDKGTEEKPSLKHLHSQVDVKDADPGGGDIKDQAIKYGHGNPPSRTQKQPEAALAGT